MLSILIPVYNFDIREFVAELHAQAVKCAIDFEILCCDDGSENQFKEINKSVNEFSNVRYWELPDNIGRSKIRNTLARSAIYDHLLFLDCDSKIYSSEFILTYVKNSRNNSVICGGTSYESAPPQDKRKYLKWLYGTKREVISAEKRQRNPYKSFKIYNLFISRSIFFDIQFDEDLTEYGHEDTLFGSMLSKKKIPVLHINSPLCHVGLDFPEEFLSKTEKGLQNLIYILKSKSDIKGIKILSYYKLVKMLGLGFLVQGVYTRLQKKIVSNLNSGNPSLLLYDFYKLGYLISIDKG